VPGATPGCANPAAPLHPSRAELSSCLPAAAAGVSASAELFPQEAGSVTKEREPYFQARAALAW